MEFKQLSDWTVFENTCSARIIVGGSIDKVEDRVAVIEKTPRVRVNKWKYGVENGERGCSVQNSDAWVYGDKGDNGFDSDSREWCDNMLSLLGWE